MCVCACVCVCVCMHVCVICAWLLVVWMLFIVEAICLPLVYSPVPVMSCLSVCCCNIMFHGLLVEEGEAWM